jgi:hypothetical protein
MAIRACRFSESDRIAAALIAASGIRCGSCVLEEVSCSIPRREYLRPRNSL